MTFFPVLSIENFILFIVGIVNIALGSAILLRGERMRADRALVTLLMAIGLWAWALTYARLASDIMIALFVVRFLYGIALLIPFLFFVFALFFLTPKRKLSRIIFLLPLLIIILTLFSQKIIEGVILISQNNQFLFGRWYFLFVTYILVYFGVGIFVIGKKYIKAPFNSIEKIQLRFILIGALIPISVSMITNVFFLSILNNFNYQWLGPTSTLAMTTLFTYAIFKHHLFNLKVITTELFSAALIFVLFLQIFAVDSLKLRFASIAIFFGATAFGILLVRSVLREVRDREDLERLTQELSNANEELKKLDKAKSEFISIASHQLRTPLSIIKGYISMMQEGSFGRLTKKLTEPLRRVYLSNERLIKLVNDLLDLSRMEGGRMRYEMKPEQFSLIIASVIEEFRQIAQSKGVLLRFKKEKEDSPVRLDEEKMRQVAFNLIDNAVRYTPKGGTITVTLVINPYHLLFSVTDTGIGLDKQEINSLFQKFVRSREVARIHTEGVGLGLYVARRIVEDHGGRIWVESSGKGKGSAFFVELPIKKIIL